MMIAKLYFTKYSLPLRCVCLAQNILLTSVASLCSMASTLGHNLWFWFGLCSSCKNNLSFELWKVKCATKLVGNFGCTHWNVAYVNFHKALRTWQWNMGLILRAYSATHVAQSSTPNAFIFQWDVFHIILEPTPKAFWFERISLHTL
jgi:hypothetical protein